MKSYQFSGAVLLAIIIAAMLSCGVQLCRVRPTPAVQENVR